MFQKIDPKIWFDEKVMEMDTETKLVFIFLLTHPNCNNIGAMRFTVPGLAAEVSGIHDLITSSCMQDILQQLAEKDIIHVDFNLRWLYFRKYIRYHYPRNVNILKSYHSNWALIPDSELKTALWDDIINEFRFVSKQTPSSFETNLNFFRTITDADTDTDTDTEEDTDKDTDKDISVVCPDQSSETLSEQKLRVSFNRKKSEYSGITEELMASLEKTFPAVDVEYELNRSAIWLTANPKRRPKGTAGWVRFISNWLDREQKSSGEGYKQKKKKKPKLTVKRVAGENWFYYDSGEYREDKFKEKHPELYKQWKSKKKKGD